MAKAQQYSITRNDNGTFGLSSDKTPQENNNLWDEFQRFEDHENDNNVHLSGDLKNSLINLATDMTQNIETPVDLTPGWQTVNSSKVTPLKLKGMRGKTLLNLLGRPNTNMASEDGRSIVTKLDAGSYSLKSKTGTETDIFAVCQVKPYVKPNDFYLAAVKLTVVSGSASIRIIEFTSGSAVVRDEVNTTPSTPGTYIMYHAFKSTPTTDYLQARVNLYNASGGNPSLSNQVNISDYRIYNITEDEYNKLRTDASPDYIETNYPYVDDIKPVRNPYVIRQSENLLPPTALWTASLSKGNVRSDTGPYEIVIDASGSGTTHSLAYVNVDVEPNTQYTLSTDYHNAYIGVYKLDGATAISGYTMQPSLTFTTAADVTRVRVYFSKRTLLSGRYILRNPMMVKGGRAKPFKPKEEKMIAFETDLYGTNATGAVCDHIFEKDGQYYKASNFKAVELNREQTWLVGTSYAGYKYIQAAGSDFPGLDATDDEYDDMYVIKYDGKPLRNKMSFTTYGADCFNYNIGGNLTLTVSSTESGWGDNYAPTVDEVAAYMLGWKMFDSASDNSLKTGVYNGTGTKAWTPLDSFSGTMFYGSVSTVPTARPISGVNIAIYTVNRSITPYTFVYRLRNTNVQPINAEGDILLHEGDNSLFLGTGLVLRDRSTPLKKGVTMVFNNAAGALQYKTEKILKLYANERETGTFENDMITSPQGIKATGGGYVSINIEAYDPSSRYALTYVQLNNFPKPSRSEFYYPSSLKSIIQELVDKSSESSSRLTALETMNNDKQGTFWMSPTLLNSWIDYGSGYAPMRYMKDRNNMVYIEGVIKNGTTTKGTQLFRLPVGYRPAKTRETVSCSGASGVSVGIVDVDPDGYVKLNAAMGVFNNALLTFSISFPAGD